MPKRNALSAARCRTAPPGKHEDGGGLRLVKDAPASGSWIWRFTALGGRRREMGLGAFPTVSLAAARAARDRWAAVRAEGQDPIEMRAAEARRAAASGRTLAEATELAFEARRAGLRDDGIAGRWLSPLRVHVLPSLGNRDVEGLGQSDFEGVLRPIWNAKPDTARKAVTRLDIVLRHAAARGLRVDLNALALAREVLGQRVQVVKNIAAMPWAEVPAFYASLTDGRPPTLPCGC